jgi:hypothetical protein
MKGKATIFIPTAKYLKIKKSVWGKPNPDRNVQGILT